jgi:hypothetical protein
MKAIYKMLITIPFILWTNIAFGDIHVEDYARYIAPRNIIPRPIYADFLGLYMSPFATQLMPGVRQTTLAYPGDYFFPADAYIPYQFAAKYLHARLTADEINSTGNFLKEYLSSRFSDTTILSSLKGYSFEIPGSQHREPYTMLADGDTVYVISGWLGKFLSFYRVVPGDFRLTVPELIDQLDKLTPLAREINEKGFRHESDSLNYLWEYVDKDKMFRIRNYLMKATLPPNPPDSPEKYYNLIEITKFYDKGVIP